MQDLLAQLPVIVAVVGPIGSVIELLGTAFDVPPMVSFGKTLESVGVDLPKMVAGVFSTLRAAAK